MATQKNDIKGMMSWKVGGMGPIGDFVGGESKKIGELSCERQVADMVTVQ